MKVFKSILITIALLLICSVGVLAVDSPISYINEEGTIQQCTNYDTLTTSSDNGADGSAKTLTLEPLTPTDNGGSWYYLGQDQTDSILLEKIEFAKVTTPPETSNQYQTGTVNIIVGSNGTGGSAAAVAVSSGFSIPSGVIVNIYQEAYAVGSNSMIASPNNCYLWFTGSNSGSSANPGITVGAGATLNVMSGAIAGVGGSSSGSGGSGSSPDPANGILINGTVAVSTFGTLEGVAPTGQSNAIAIEQASGTNTNPSLISSGRVCSYSGNGNTTTYTNGSGITGLNYLTVNNGAVSTSTSLQATQSANPSLTQGNGIWMQLSPTDGMADATVFGNATFYNNLAIRSAFGPTESLTIPANTSLTLAGGNLNFGTKNSQSPATPASNNAQLTIGSNATFNIGVEDPSSNVFNSQEPNVTMNADSTLNNSGDINVRSYSTSENS